MSLLKGGLSFERVSPTRVHAATESTLSPPAVIAPRQSAGLLAGSPERNGSPCRHEPLCNLRASGILGGVHPGNHESASKCKSGRIR